MFKMKFRSVGDQAKKVAFLILAVAGMASTIRAQGPSVLPDVGRVNVAELAQQVSELRETVRLLQEQVRELQQQSRPQLVAASYVAPKPEDTIIWPPLTSADKNGQQDAGATNLAAHAYAEEEHLATSYVPAQPATSNASEVPSPLARQAINPAAAPTAESNKGFDFLHGTTMNFLMDGYYAYNFNNPIGRVNLLRAYDVTSNAFSLNQAAVVLENAADPTNGKRFGARLDLQFGQATETLQGNAVNEPRPQVYRNIFQAYGTYIVPIGSGLTFDFGKWTSSLGFENNYTQDQMNYSRSYWFNFLPYYHMGARLHYQVNDKLALNYWLTNGTQQTEPFNGYKDELFGFVLTPTKNVTWTVNYYLGQEHPDFRFVANGAPNLPTLQGTPFAPIPNPPKGKLHILDSYANWNATAKLTLAGEADYVIERQFTDSAPAHTEGGAAYARYQLWPKIGLTARGEYLADYGGLFSGKTQALKEATITFEYKFSNGFLMREEWRKDWSNQPYFLTATLGNLKKSQDTATVGLVWWFGGKEGTW